MKFNENKIIPWTLGILFFLAIISNEIFNTSICWIFIITFLLSFYSFIFYLKKNDDSNDKLIKYNLYLSIAISIFFIFQIFSCKF